MKKIQIRIQLRVPDAKTLLSDATDAVFETIDAARGIRRIGEGIRLREKPAPAPIPDADTEEETDVGTTFSAEDYPPLSRADLAMDRFLATAEDAVKRGTKVAASFVDEVKRDIDAICERDPAAKSRAEVLLLYSGLHALLAYRVSHAWHTSGHTFAARALSQAARFLTGIEIHPGATIGQGLFIDHGSGVVIGETAIIGDNCTLYQGVTLGGTGKDVGKRHPTLGDNVLVGAGAKLLGNFTVGDGAKIASGAVVLGDVPAEATAVGIPARVVRRAGKRVCDEFDQTHIPDPVAQELCRLNVRLEALEAKERAEKSSDIPDTEVEK